MPSYVWLIIIGVILLLFYMWSQYGAVYQAMRDNPEALHAGQATIRYVTDVKGLVNAYEAAENADGSFMSRLGAFFGALPT